MSENVISVLGGTGAQGGGVVDALLAAGSYKVRVATRNPSSDAANALRARGVEVVKADMLEPSSLKGLYEGAHGAFVVSNFWDPVQGEREEELAVRAVNIARSAGVKHLVWSTLPDVKTISGGRFEVKHFTLKARVDAVVRSAGFDRHTFVEAPFYFQNLLKPLAPQPLPDGGRGWAVPMDPAARVIHAGDITDLGRTVAAAFGAGDALANGSYLAVCGGTYSWDDFVATFRALGHDVRVVRVAPEVYDGFFPNAKEAREMFQYFEAYSYFGPEAAANIAAAKALVPSGFATFSDWARKNIND
ncbi:NmrA/HSCARG family protein [Pendulispora rubella]|uniref:NmrA/HSCARG family protein n=1 Tax=Pendulispora rubella TaxID=2741070 RepID=A0ABZ2KZJ4_9BACT